jgi:hypothetical protein
MTGLDREKKMPSLAPSSPLGEYMFNANGVCSSQPGATRQETAPQNSASAESASQGNRGLISHLSFGESDESRFQRYRFQIDFPGAMPQAGIKAAPLALNTWLREERLARRVTPYESEEW